VFADTLDKFVLIIGLFAVFLVLVNVFAARQHATSRRAGSFRRHRRRRHGPPVPPMPGEDDSAAAGEVPDTDAPGSATQAPGAAGADPAANPSRRRAARLADLDEDDAPSLLRKMGPQLLLSAVALAVAGLALFVMWQVAGRG
jgi:hypothetical protein